MAYIAGLLDGEGTITIVKNNRRKELRPYIGIVNTNKDVLMWIKNKLGGGTYKASNSAKKKTYIWKIQSHTKIFVILGLLTPYLKIKRKQAELLFEFCKSRLEKMKKQYNPPYSERELSIYEKIKILNRGD